MADASVTITGVIPSDPLNCLRGIAGVTIAPLDIIYKDTSDSDKLKLADANGSALAKTVLGMAVTGGGAGQPIQYVRLDPAITIGATTPTSASGDVYYLSETPGKMTKTYSEVTSGSAVVVLGGMMSATVMNFDPIVLGTK